MTAPLPMVRPTQPCVACGRETTQRWCSLACFRAEDGDERERPASEDPDED